MVSFPGHEAHELFYGSQKVYVEKVEVPFLSLTGHTPTGSCNNTLLRRILRRLQEVLLGRVLRRRLVRASVRTGILRRVLRREGVREGA